MENLFKWTLIAFGLNSSKSCVKNELEMAQLKISEVESSLMSAKEDLVMMFDRSDVSVEELSLKERQFEVLSRLFIKKRISLINRIVTSCLNGIKSFQHEIQANPSTLLDDSTNEKLKHMGKALSYIKAEKDLPKRSQEVKLFQELKHSIKRTFKFITSQKQFERCNSALTFEVFEDRSTIEAKI